MVVSRRPHRAFASACKTVRRCAGRAVRRSDSTLVLVFGLSFLPLVRCNEVAVVVHATRREGSGKASESRKEHRRRPWRRRSPPRHRADVKAAHPWPASALGRYLGRSVCEADSSFRNTSAGWSPPSSSRRARNTRGGASVACSLLVQAAVQRRCSSAGSTAVPHARVLFIDLFVHREVGPWAENALRPCFTRPRGRFLIPIAHRWRRRNETTKGLGPGAHGSPAGPAAGDCGRPRGSREPIAAHQRRQGSPRSDRLSRTGTAPGASWRASLSLACASSMAAMDTSPSLNACLSNHQRRRVQWIQRW